jgi:hypothetical protein
MRYREEKYHEEYTDTFDRIEHLVQQFNQKFALPLRHVALTLEQVTTHLNKAATVLRQHQKASVELCFSSYTDLLATCEADMNPSTEKTSAKKAAAVQNTSRSESCRLMFHNIRRVVKPTESSGLHKLMIPRHKDQTEYPADFQQALATMDPDDIIWDTVLDKETIEQNLLRYNRNSFRAAAASPCGSGIIHKGLSFNSLSAESEALLSGTIPPQWYGQDETLREFLTSFAIPDIVKKNPTISTDISEDDVKFGFTKWKETTSTSPSGRHLGHYKAIIKDSTWYSSHLPDPIPARSSTERINPQEGCNAVNILIEKDPGRPKLTRLRIIHLFEADFNLFLKLIWGSRLVKRAASLNLLNDGQHGSTPRKKAIDPIMLTQLTTDLCRILKHNLARFDNNASACYDRIIVALGMLAARRCGMPDTAVQTHADCLQLMKYTVKTVHGISESNYHGTTFEPLYGTSQGSGASPSVWLTLVVVRMNTLDRLIPDRMSFQSPDTSQRHDRLIDAFVDDTSLGFTDPGLITLETMIAKLNHIAQTWENILFYSGGALNLSKCSWFTMYWDWKKGRPILRRIKGEDPQPFTLVTQGSTTDPTTITRHPLSKASRILGVYLAPDGNFSEQLTVLKTKADGFAIKL